MADEGKTANRKRLPGIEEVSPLREIIHEDFYAAILLFVAAVAAIVIANTNLAGAYRDFWKKELAISIFNYRLGLDLRHWVNDGLMALFFFAVGLEIKRELLVGELASVRRAALPAAAALGGMAAPAVIYLFINILWNGAPHGWGIPVATDIAFVIGAMGLLGNRVPHALGVFLIALAIVDDIGAILVIAVFYTDNVSFWSLGAGLTAAAISYAVGRWNVHRVLPYLILGVLTWFFFLKSGVHATVAGVLMAFTIPPYARYETPLFNRRMGELLGSFAEAEDGWNPLLVNARQQDLIRFIIRECRRVEAPLQRFERYMHPLAVFVVMPIFAFANSGVAIEWNRLGALLTTPVLIGVTLGLLIGKQLGIMLFSFLTVKMRLASLPSSLGWRHIHGAGWLAGMGFTMSLFIAQLAFAGRGAEGEEHLMQAKIGIFIATTICGLTGYLILRLTCKRT
jgi:NhaA family Na+:H+ antiporter